MKIKRRVLALLLSMVMVLTFMPALAFAEVEEPGGETVTNSKMNGNDEEFSFSFTPVATKQYDIEDYWDDIPIYFEDGDKVKIDGEEYFYNSTARKWKTSAGVELSYDLEAWPDTDIYYLNDGQAFKYSVFCYEDDVLIGKAGGFNAVVFCVYKTVWMNGLKYELNDFDKPEAGVWGRADSLPGNITVSPNAVLSDGASHVVTQVYLDCFGLSSITVPTTVTVMRLSEVPAGFTIFGTTGSYAQTYAAQNGISFRDPAAEAEAARQGTQVAGLPKVKISKPAAAKKSVTVKWKKLDKKQLKKGVTNIEVWVCPNSAFGSADTIIKFAGKKKASLKVKGLKKGTYFVKVRAIKNVGGVKQYTAWSKVKKVKVKK